MKKLLLSIFILSIISFETFSHVEHYSRYNYLEYELFRNNDPIGFHKFEFKRDGKNLKVDSEIKFNITKLGIDLYQRINFYRPTFRRSSSKPVVLTRTVDLGLCTGRTRALLPGYS